MGVCYGRGVVAARPAIRVARGLLAGGRYSVPGVSNVRHLGELSVPGVLVPIPEVLF